MNWYQTIFDRMVSAAKEEFPEYEVHINNNAGLITIIDRKTNKAFQIGIDSRWNPLTKGA